MKKEVKERAGHRLKIIEGQVRGLQKMIEDEKYCIDIITQFSAIRHALGSLEDIVLENHLATHVKEQMQHGKDRQAIAEILAVYKLAKKK